MFNEYTREISPKIGGTLGKERRNRLRFQPSFPNHPKNFHKDFF